MSHHTRLTVRLAAAAAASSATVLLSVSPALAHPAPEPNYAGTVLVLPAAMPTITTAESPVDVGQLGAAGLVGLAVGAGAMLGVRAVRRPHAHAAA
jgi:hypothetical protein